MRSPTYFYSCHIASAFPLSNRMPEKGSANLVLRRFKVALSRSLRVNDLELSANQVINRQKQIISEEEITIFQGAVRAR